MPPCGICQPSTVWSMRRPTKTRPSALSSMTPTQGRYGRSSWRRNERDMVGFLGGLLSGLGDYGRSRHQNKAPARKPLAPALDAIDRHRIDEAGAGRVAARARQTFERRQVPVDLERGLDLVDGGIGLGESDADTTGH